MTVAQGRIPSGPNTSHTRRVPSVIEAPSPHNTQLVGTKRLVGSTSLSLSSAPSSSDDLTWRSPSPPMTNVGVRGVRGTITPLLRIGLMHCERNSLIMGMRDTTLSATIIANDVQRIQPRAPFVISPTGPGAQPRNFDNGESTAHPTIIPWT